MGLKCQTQEVGAKYKFFIPYELAYGKKGAREEVQPNIALIFEIELLEIKAPEQKVN